MELYDVMRTTFACREFTGEPVPVHVTVSVGVACYPETDATVPEQLIEIADKALYQAKHAGRNRTAG